MFGLRFWCLGACIWDLNNFRDKKGLLYDQLAA